MVQGSNRAASFTIAIDGEASDDELSTILRDVYVTGGFSAPDVAERLFAGPAVRARGTLITARGLAGEGLLGMVMLVPPGSAIRQIAHGTEGEVHLLAVRPSARRRGIARALVQAAIEVAADRGYAGLVLSTQEGMKAAHAVYEAAGFERTPARDWSRAGVPFYAYQLSRVTNAEN